MKTCIKCGSHAFNLYAKEIDQGGFCDVHYWQGRAHRAEALAQPEQEPVFLIYDDAGGWIESNESDYSKTEDVNRWLLYTAPPRRPWVELTVADRWKILYATEQDERITVMQLVEAKLKEKNT